MARQYSNIQTRFYHKLDDLYSETENHNYLFVKLFKNQDIELKILFKQYMV